jgi:tRNA A37 threonylcarbamoyltransferase TsaD
MPDDNETQALALAKALAPTLLELLKPAMTEHIDASISGLKKKNEELLEKLAKRTDLAPNESPRKITEDIHLSREEARNAQTYREAEALAKANGVRVRITTDVDGDQALRNLRRAEPTTIAALKGKTHLVHDGVLYITSAAMRDRQNFVRLEQQAKREHLRFQPIATFDNLPEGVVDANP